MESRFPQRVALEREALDSVNFALNDVRPLVGLSSLTVEAWVSKSSRKLGVENVKILVDAIRMVAEAARSEADVSDEIFVDISPEEAAEALDALKHALVVVQTTRRP